MAGFFSDITVNPFIPNPAFAKPEEANFIEKGISNGIEKGLGNVGDKVLQAGKVKTESMMHNLPEIATLALVMYLIYLGYMSFIRKDGRKREIDFSRMYVVFMVYIVFKLFWKVVLKI